MTDSKRRDIAETIKILMHLDSKSLFLINNNARMLAARQDMDKENTGKDEMLAL